MGKSSNQITLSKPLSLNIYAIDILIDGHVYDNSVVHINSKDIRRDIIRRQPNMEDLLLPENAVKIMNI